jgi:hypothetical protein
MIILNTIVIITVFLLIVSFFGVSINNDGRELLEEIGTIDNVLFCCWFLNGLTCFAGVENDIGGWRIKEFVDSVNESPYDDG